MGVTRIFQCIVGFLKAVSLLILQILKSALMPKAKPAAAKRSKTSRKKPYEKGPKPESLRQHKAGRQARLDINNESFMESDDMTVEVVFKNLGTTIVAQLDMTIRGDFVFAAIAWLTSKHILEAMARAVERGVHVFVVVQKEKWLRKGRSQTEFHKKLRDRYDTLGSHSVPELVEPLLSTFYSPGPKWKFDSSKKQEVAAVRCLGDEVVSEFNARRMHNKFVVFGRRGGKEEARFVATKVWTGSYNFSASAELSLENAVCIKSIELASAYAREFAGIFLNSEPLDWISRTMLPPFTCNK